MEKYEHRGKKFDPQALSIRETIHTENETKV